MMKFQVLHVAPLRVKLVGIEFVPLQEPLKPMFTEALEAILLFHDIFCAVILVPLWDQLAFHPCCNCWLFGKVNFRFHPFSAAVPVLVMVTLPVKPFDH